MKAANIHSKAILLAFGLALAASPVAMAEEEEQAQGQFPDTTLAGIYEIALTEDLTLAQAKASYRAGREERKLALAGLLPQLSASASRTDTDTESRGQFAVGSLKIDNATDTSSTQESWNISLSQPLFDLPAWFRFKQGADLTQQSETTFSIAQQNLVVRTVTAYFAVLRASANLRASTAQEEALKAQLDQVRQRFDVGLVAITDVLEAEAGYDLAVARRITDQGQLDISREQLSVLTGRPHGELWPLKAAFPVNKPDPASPEEWVNFSLANNLDIKSAQYGRDAAQHGMRAAKTQYYPRVALSASHLDSTTDSTQTDIIKKETSDVPSDQLRDSVAISVTMPLYSGGRLNSSTRQAIARYDTQNALYEGTIRGVTQETRAYFSQVLSDVSRSNARARAVASTSSALEAAEIGYEVGTRNVVDVLNAQQSFFSAKRDYDTSILDYVIDLVQLKRRAGTLSPKDIYELNRWLITPDAKAAEEKAAEQRAAAQKAATQNRR